MNERMTVVGHHRWPWPGRLGAVLLLLCTVVGAPRLASAEPFDDWLVALRAEAVAEGIDPAIVESALAGVQPIEKVIELDRRQPEGRLTFKEYQRRVLSADRVEHGRRLLQEHRALLERVAADFGVQPRFIVALWGIESSYGSYFGDFSVVAALATLAYDGRRSSFFRGELIKALRILDRGDITVEAMRGSWAGAMGQSQFMPSSYLAYAVDYDGDGRRDIWSTLPDVFASIANYLAKAGWNQSYTWGREVRLAGALDGDLAGLETRKPLAEWQAMGVRRSNGRDLPMVTIDASLLHMDDGEGPAFLVYDNFRVLMAWNRSAYFGLTVGELADRIARG